MISPTSKIVLQAVDKVCEDYTGLIQVGSFDPKFNGIMKIYGIPENIASQEVDFLVDEGLVSVEEIDTKFYIGKSFKYKVTHKGKEELYPI